MIINKTPGVGLNDAVEDSFQAFLVDGAYFTHKEEYPILHEDMISKKPPKKIMPFSKATVKYSKTTNEFAVINKKGIVTTYYHPDRGIYEYYKDRRNHR